MTKKLCECGCGQPTPICQYTNRNYGYVKGEPLRFIPGHQGRLTRWDDARRANFRRKMAGHPVSEETRRRISEAHKAAGTKPSAEAIAKSNDRRGRRDKSPSWKGGTSLVNGYRCTYDPTHPRAHPNGYVYEHILIAEQKLGRPLLPKEVVHHLDGDKANNSPENLIVLDSQSEHITLHRQRGDIP
jgi:hypothetical protein